MEINREGFAVEYNKAELQKKLETLMASKANLENLPREIEAIIPQDSEQ